MKILMSVIDGVITPKALCGIATQNPLAKEPKLCSKTFSQDIECYKKLHSHFDTVFDKSDPLNRKMFLVTQMALTAFIVSMSFLPSDQSKNQLLFIQKMDACEERVGFVAPYLLKEQRKEWNAKKTVSEYYTIGDEQSIDKSIVHLEEAVQSKIKEILLVFLQDQETKALTLTMKEPTGEHQTICWVNSLRV